jgi:hypothetical protein
MKGTVLSTATHAVGITGAGSRVGLHGMGGIGKTEEGHFKRLEDRAVPVTMKAAFLLPYLAPAFLQLAQAAHCSSPQFSHAPCPCP